MDNIIDEKTKAFLVACLVTGIDVTEVSPILMDGLVTHLNSTDRVFYAVGDEDGIIVHDMADNPFMYLMYNGHRLTFTLFGEDQFLTFDTNKIIGYALLNIIGYLQNEGYDFKPSILGSEAHVIENYVAKEKEETTPEDWAL